MDGLSTAGMQTLALPYYHLSEGVSIPVLFGQKMLNQGVTRFLSRGNSTTSLTFPAPVRTIKSLATPNPQPA